MTSRKAGFDKPACRMAGRSALHLNGRAKALRYKSAPKVCYVHSIGISFFQT